MFRFATMVLNAGVEQKGTTYDFVGHVSADDFIIVTDHAHAPDIVDYVTQRFKNEVGTFYSFRDRERGYILLKDKMGGERQAPLMALAVGVVTSEMAQFSDIREITEIAAAERRKVAQALAAQL